VISTGIARDDSGGGMELLQGIKLFSVPLWVKILILILLGVLGLVNTTLFFTGLLYQNHESWVKSSIDLLGVVLPIFIIMLVIWKSETGVDSLRRKTEDFLMDLLPSALGKIVEVNAPFFEVGADRELADHPTKARIFINLLKNDCYSDFVILAPDPVGFVEIVIRLEINVKKVNFNLCLDEALAGERFAEEHPGFASNSADNTADVAKWVFSRFRHTLAGAGMQEGAHVQTAEPAPGRYDFNQNVLRRAIGDRTVLCFVASCSVAPDFLYNPGERLFFAQDLMFFLRSFLTEGRDMFRTVLPRDVDSVARELLQAG
jgi:hypothetical protein